LTGARPPRYQAGAGHPPPLPSDRGSDAAEELLDSESWEQSVEELGPDLAQDRHAARQGDTVPDRSTSASETSLAMGRQT